MYNISTQSKTILSVVRTIESVVTPPTAPERSTLSRPSHAGSRRHPFQGVSRASRASYAVQRCHQYQTGLSSEKSLTTSRCHSSGRIPAQGPGLSSPPSYLTQEERMLMTGRHVVVDIACNSCGSVLGWKYEKAYEPSQKARMSDSSLTSSARHPPCIAPTPCLDDDRSLTPL